MNLADTHFFQHKSYKCATDAETAQRQEQRGTQLVLPPQIEHRLPHCPLRRRRRPRHRTLIQLPSTQARRAPIVAEALLLLPQLYWYWIGSEWTASGWVQSFRWLRLRTSPARHTPSPTQSRGRQWRGSDGESAQSCRDGAGAASGASLLLQFRLSSRMSDSSDSGTWVPIWQGT